MWIEQNYPENKKLTLNDNNKLRGRDSSLRKGIKNENEFSKIINIEMAIKKMNSLNQMYVNTIDDSESDLLSYSLQQLDKKGIDYFSMSLDTPQHPSRQIKISKIFRGDMNQSRKSFARYMKCLISFDNDIPKDTKDKLKDNINKGYYYITFKVDGREHLFENSNVWKYFSYCARNEISPDLSVRFLCTCTNNVKRGIINPVA